MGDTNPALELLAGNDSEDFSDVIPGACDLFDPTPDQIKKWRKDRKVLDHVSIAVFRNGQKVQQPGSFPAAEATRQWLQDMWGEGVFEAIGKTSSGGYMVRRQLTIGSPAASMSPEFRRSADPAPAQASGASGGFGDLENLVRLLALLKTSGLMGDAGGGRQDSIRDAVAAIATMQSQSQQMMQMFLQQMMEARKQNEPSPDLIATILKAKFPEAGGRQSGGGMSEIVEVLKVARELQGMAGAGAEDKPGDLELVVDTVRPMVTPLLGLLSQFVPEAQRESFLQLLIASVNNPAEGDVVATGEAV